MVDQIVALVKSLFEEGTDIGATIAQIVNLVVGKIFGFISETEGYNA